MEMNPSWVTSIQISSIIFKLMDPHVQQMLKPLDQMKKLLDQMLKLLDQVKKPLDPQNPPLEYGLETVLTHLECTETPRIVQSIISAVMELHQSTFVVQEHISAWIR